MKIYHLSFHEFGVNVFKAILSIQTSYRKINHNSLRRFLFANNRFIKYNLGDTLGLTRL